MAIYRLNHIQSLAGRRIFVDANVLIYLFWPTGQHRFEENYARCFRELLRRGNDLMVDFLVISEVINRILRIEYQKVAPSQSFKQFRDSEEGREALNDIYTIVRENILVKFKIIGKAFDEHDVLGFLNVEALDFVDKATVALCMEQRLVLLTNDKDFKVAPIDILTGNPSIFQ